MTTTCKLVGSAWTVDTYGVYRESLTEREVFCTVDSVTRAEFFDAGRNGLNPSFKLTVFSADYEGETMLILDGETYRIYRTYSTGDDIELYVERQGGANGKGADDGSGEVQP